MRSMTGETGDGTPRRDSELLELYAQGDHAAARDLTHRLAPAVFGLAVRMLGDRTEAEDVTQEAMLRLWQIADRWTDHGAQPGTWLYRVANNLCIDRLRRRRHVYTDRVPEMADDRPGALETMAARDRKQALEAALASLPERQRAAIVLRHLEERTNPEIAAILDTTVEAVESLLARGRRALADRLTPQRSEIGLAGEHE
jgi:RNA polymerase sigma factor (sigma-70 family)